jgi:hypothetical protein
MTRADRPFSTPYLQNLAYVLDLAFRLAEQAGNEQDAAKRAELISTCMQLWRCAQSVRRRYWPDAASRA